MDPESPQKAAVRPIPQPVQSSAPKRSLGSVIKLLTPSEDYTEAHNEWLNSLPTHILVLVYVIKRFHNPAWGDDWRRHFNVDTVNGTPGHELKLHDRKLVGTYLRVGLSGDHGWRTFKVRQDFLPAAKVQTEDDISASVVVPGERLEGLPVYFTDCQGPSLKFIQNCEYRLFQRPDDAGPSRFGQASRGRSGTSGRELHLKL